MFFIVFLYFAALLLQIKHKGYNWTNLTLYILMKYTERQFVPLLFVGDINSYSMARAFYEAYGVKSIVYGKLYTMDLTPYAS